MNNTDKNNEIGKMKKNQCNVKINNINNEKKNYEKVHVKDSF